MRGAEKVLPYPVRPKRGEEAEREAPELGPADKFQRKDRRCQGRAEDGREAAADAAEEQGAPFFLGKGEETRELIRDGSTHLQGRAFPSDRRPAQVREQREAKDHRRHRSRQRFLRVLDFRDQRFPAVRAALPDTGVCPDGRCTDERKGPKQPRVRGEGRANPSQAPEEARGRRAEGKAARHQQEAPATQ